MSFTACADLVRRGDPDRFLATMAAPVAARRVLFPLYAFNLEVARAPWVTAEPMIAQMRLQWWRDALGEIAAGGEVRRHEVATPLAGVLDGARAGALDALVAARLWEIEEKRFPDIDALRRYIDDTQGCLMWVAASALGAADEPVIRDFSFAAGAANWLRAVPDLRARGCDPLPGDGPDTARALARDGLDRLTRARAARGRVSKQAGHALLAGWQAGPVLEQVLADPARVASGGLGQGEMRKRLSLMVRAASGRW